MTRWLAIVPLVLALAACDDDSGGGAPASGSGGGAAPAKAAAQESKKAAAKHPYAGFKAGSFARLKTVSETEVMGNKSKTEMEIKTTILEVTADKVVIEMETKMPNLDPIKQKSEIPLKTEANGQASGPKPKEGNEEVKVPAGSFKCRWIETESDAGGNKSVTRVWQSEDVPGFTVKCVSKMSGQMSSETTQELVEYKAN